MAHDPSKTEQATPKRRQQAREEGSVLRLTDLDSLLLLVANLFLFFGAWSGAMTLLGQQMAHHLRLAGEGGGMPERMGPLALEVGLLLVKGLVPFLAVNLGVALLNQFVQHGWHPSFKPLQPKLTRLSPTTGFRRLFSARALVEILKSVVKLGILVWVAYAVLREHLPQILATLKAPLSQSIACLQTTLFVLYRNLLVALVCLVVPDLLYQRYQFEKGLRMTKQEVRDEAKDAEGNPEVRSKRRSLMVQSVMRRIRTAVPKATVVITNPSHFAVALEYDAQKNAPICVAKGVDHLAFHIRTLAQAHGVVVVENPPLARALYWSVDLDQPIPPALYQGVAQVLAYVFRLKGAA